MMVLHSASKNFLLSAVTLLVICTLTVQGNSNETVIKGPDLLVIDPETYFDINLVIEIVKTYPMTIDPETGVGEGFTVAAAEHIFIFGDGSVYSRRWCFEGWIDDYYHKDYIIDDSWTIPTYGSIIYTRNSKYYLTADQIRELLGIIATYEDELVEGESILGHMHVAKIRIRYDGMEGILMESVYSGIENQERLEIIESVLKWLRDTEWGTSFDLLKWEDFRYELEERKKEAGWPKTGIRTRFTYSHLRYAREAHGLSNNY